MPDISLPETKYIVIKGLATFIELSTLEAKPSSGSSSRLTTPSTLKYHPYLSLRVRGVIHPIESQPPAPPADAKRVSGPSDTEHRQIPGWNRIVMVMYRHSPRYLIQVLEHAEENFGDHFGPAVTAQMAMATATQQQAQPASTQIQPQVATAGQTTATFNTLATAAGGAGTSAGTGTGPGSSNTGTGGTGNHSASNAPANPVPVPASNGNPVNNALVNAAGLDEETMHRLLQEHLETKLTTDPAYGNLNRKEIMAMEKDFQADYALDWTDIEYAYAYEGVVCPGGKIMMGRWWRCASIGAGIGLEVDELGVSVEQVDEDQVGDGNEDDDDGGGGDAGDADVDADGEDAAGNASTLKAAKAAAAAAARRRRSARTAKLERGPFAFWS